MKKSTKQQYYRVLGLAEGQRVGVFVNRDVPIFAAIGVGGRAGGVETGSGGAGGGLAQ